MAGSRNHRSLSQKQLLGLIRSAIWNQQTDTNLFSEMPTDWDEIGRLAMEQTVGMPALTAALSLPAPLLPPEEWRRNAYVFIERNRRTHRLVDESLRVAVGCLHDSGIKSVLLKGQAYARSYPYPELRQCGDIDLYVGETDYRSAYLAGKDLQWKEEQEFSMTAKHCGFSINGVRVELHRVAGLLTPTSVNRKFQDWSRSQIEQSTHLIEIKGLGIPIPTPLFDVVFVFMHMYLHFLSGGIGLRHLCDWTMLLHMHSNNMYVSELEDLLTEFRLMRGWRLFAPIAVDHLGLPESECPFYSKENRSKSEKILSLIMKEGNFGRAVGNRPSRPDGYIAGKAYSYRRHSSKLMRKFTIDPNTISRTYFSYTYKGLAQIINDTIKGKV